MKSSLNGKAGGVCVYHSAVQD